MYIFFYILENYRKDIQVLQKIGTENVFEKYRQHLGKVYDHITFSCLEFLPIIYCIAQVRKVAYYIMTFSLIY
jgi:hypothetical protein